MTEIQYEYLGDGVWGPKAEPDDPGTIGLNEVLERYEMVGVTDSGAVMVADRGSHQLVTPNTSVDLTPNMSELGTASPSPWSQWMRDERVAELRWPQGLQMYLRMKRSDGTIRGALREFKMPIVSARWYVSPGTGTTSDTVPTKRDQNVADWLNGMLFERMTRTWDEHINDALLAVEYGHMIFEKVFTEYKGQVEWQKLAPRHPLDVQQWVWDKQGGPAGIRMYSEKDASGLFIPIEKLLIYTFDMEGGDVRGTSALRSAYKHWYYKDQLYKIDAIQKERHGIGIPIIKLPQGFSDTDKQLAEDIGRNLRTNERAHVTLPPLWDIMFADLKGQPVDAMKSIEHHNGEIEATFLEGFLHKGGKDTDETLFMKSTRYVAKNLAACITNYGLKQLVDMNYSRVNYPSMRARRIGEWEDLRTLSFALRNLVGASIITPDDILEASMREELDLPPKDPTTSRDVANPQGVPISEVRALPDATNEIKGGKAVVPTTTPTGGAGAPVPPRPARVGPPRQSQAPNQQISPGTGRVGRDTSGG